MILTSPPCPAPRYRRLLITPHGDRELSTLRSTAYPPILISLPLMGIGKLTAKMGITPHGEPHDGQPTLITPHGDRERRSPQAIPCYLVLITPHGDRELGRTSKSLGAGAWGSGTRNTLIIAMTASGIQFSLPLMGIGNFGRVRSPSSRSLILITPHGDRERDGTRRGTGPFDSLLHSSLPLMGIGNPPYSASFTPSTPRKRLKIPL